MVDSLLGRKVGMTSVYNEAGEMIPVTVIELGPCAVVQVKNTDKDGYQALQLGFQDRTLKNVKKPMQGHFAKAGTGPKRFLHEVKWDGTGDVKQGSLLTVELFENEKKVDVIGTTKGRGFQGTVKRHGFAGGPRTHGQSDRQRAPGSIGSSSFPSRVYKGLRMAGRMGGARFTMQNLKVVKIDKERNAILVAGPVPGPNTGFVIVRRTSK